MSDMTPEDEALLRAARGAGLPTADDHDRVKRKLFAQIGIAVGAGTSALSATSGAGAGLPAAGASGAGVALVAKVAVAVALVGGAVGMGMVGLRESRPPATATATATPTATATATATATPTPTATATPTPTPTSTLALAPIFAPPVEPPLPTAPARTIVSPSRSTPDTPRSSTERVAPPESATTSVGAPATATATIDPPAPMPEPAGPATVAAEAELLRRADAARKAGDASRALDLLDEHRARFPTGILVQEREAERVVVLCALGRNGEARAAATAFLRDWPHSPLSGRVRSSCGGT